MKKLLAVVVVLMIAVMVTTGCSEHESEITKEQRVQEEALEGYLEEETAGGAWDKVPDPNAEELVLISVFKVADGNKGIEQVMEAVPELDDWELTQKLIEYKVLPSNAQITDFQPEKGIIEYTGVDSLTPRQAQAVINTFTENMVIPGQIKLLLDGKEVLTSGYNTDFDSIDDSYKGGVDDSASFMSGPGVE